MAKKKGFSVNAGKEVVIRTVYRKSKVKLPKKPGRKSHVPTEVTRQQVLEFSGMGMTHVQIAKLLMISSMTLYKYYRHELDIAEARMNFNVANNLYNIATSKEHKSAAQAAIFWMKARGRWRETNRTEVTGPDGAALPGAPVPNDVIDARDLTPEQRDTLREIIAVAALKNAADAEARQNDEDDDDIIDDVEYGYQDED
jgi:hypothetical protein